MVRVGISHFLTVKIPAHPHSSLPSPSVLLQPPESFVQWLICFCFFFYWLIFVGPVELVDQVTGHLKLF